MVKEFESLILTDPYFEMGLEKGKSLGKIEGKIEGKNEGKNEGELLGRLKVGVKILLNHNFNDETIMDFTQLTAEQVKKLRKLVAQYGEDTYSHLPATFGLSE